MSSQHAPGPWTEDPEGEIAVCIEDANGPVIATVLGPANENPNARLIAAAPTMLATLQAILESMGDTYEARDNDAENLHDLVESTIQLATKS